MLFLFEIGRVGIFQSFEEFCLLVEEFIVGDAETLKNLDVHFLRGKTDSAPLFLNLYDFLGNLFPILGSLVFSLVGSLYLFAEGSFLGEVFLFLGTQVFEVLLVLLVDNSASSLETFPNLLSQLLGNRTDFAILLVEVLKLVEGRNNILFLIEFLCSLAELGLGFKILLEVIFASFAVQLEHVVELLYIELIVLPYLVCLVCRDVFDFLPFLLQGLEVLI